MDDLTYQDFDLWIAPTTGGYRARVWDSQGRQATADFRLSMNELEGLLLRLAPPHRGAGRAEPEKIEAAKSFGGRLFKAVFRGELLSCLRTSLEEAKGRKAGLRIRLRLTEAPELANLPWEYLYDANRDRFFALSVKTPVVRYLELSERIPPLTVPPPLRVLVMLANPHDYTELDVEQEWRQLDEALSGLKERGLIELERQEGATLEALRRRLRQGEIHALHFIGHGGFSEDSHEGVLILEDEGGQGHRVRSEVLAVLLHDHAPLRLAVLNVCEGGRASRGEPFAGVAQTLIRQGIPAVVAMQSVITDVTALTLAREFYRALADGYPVDASLTEARQVVFAHGIVEWGAPVLYLRAENGRIFDTVDPGESFPERIREGTNVLAKDPGQVAGQLLPASAAEFYPENPVFQPRDGSSVREPAPPSSGGEVLAKNEESLLDQVFDTLAHNPILMLLAQDGRAERVVLSEIESRSREIREEEGTYHVTPPGASEASVEEYFVSLGCQCGFAKETRSPAAWEDALDRRLRSGEQLFLLVNSFEKGSAIGRRELGSVLRALRERHDSNLWVVLSGGERLAALKYENGQDSVLNAAERLDWPEATVGDVLTWHRREFPEVDLDPRDAEDLLKLCGGHPRLVRRCLERRYRSEPESDHEMLLRYDVVWNLFTPHLKDAETQRRLCAWLKRDDLGHDQPWLVDELLRRLYWSNALAGRGRTLRWRCEVIREVGEEALECGSQRGLR